MHAHTHIAKHIHMQIICLSDERHAQKSDQIFSYQSVSKHLFKISQKVFQDAVDTMETALFEDADLHKSRAFVLNRDPGLEKNKVIL